MSAEATPITARAFAAAIEELPISTLHLKAAELRNSLAHLEYSNAQLESFARPPPGSSDQPDQDCIEAIDENIGVISRYRERLELLKQEAEKRGLDWDELEKQFQNSGVAAGTAEEADLSPQEREALRQLSATLPDAPLGDVTASSTNTEAQEDRMMVDGQRVGTHSAWTDGTFQMGRINAAGEIVMDVDPAAHVASPSTAAQATNGVVTNGVSHHEDEPDIQGVTATTTSGTNARQGGRLSDEELRRRMAGQLGDDEEEGMHL